MTNWKETLNIADLHSAYEAGTLPVEKLAAEVYARCMKLKCAKDSIFTDAASAFIDIDDVDDYDDALTGLYNYGDMGNRLWIRT